MKTLITLGLSAAALLASTGAMAQTTLDATFTGTGTESGAVTPVPGVQHIDLTGKFLTYAASSNLPQLNGNDLSQYSFDFNGVSANYDDATRTATYNVTGTISGYGQVVQTFATEPLTVTFSPTFSTATILGTLMSNGSVTPPGFPGPIDFSAADGATISGLYTSFGPGAGGSVTGSINFFAAAVPEAATWSMMILGMGAIGFAMRRQRVTTRLSYAS